MSVDTPDLLRKLEAGLDEAGTLNGFRFPPNDESPTVYNDVKRAAFGALFEVSTTCFIALCGQETLPSHMQNAVQRSPQTQPPLFGKDANSHEPFTTQHVFGQSFFNLFNYNHGLLNPHFDRSLLTVIKAMPGTNDKGTQSALWIRAQNGTWTNADEAVESDEVIIMIGEDCEGLSFAKQLSLYAAEHAVRVNPTGEYIAHSHFQPDPDTPRQLNRRSAAFILRHDPLPMAPVKV